MRERKGYYTDDPSLYSNRASNSREKWTRIHERQP